MNTNYQKFCPRITLIDADSKQSFARSAFRVRCVLASLFAPRRPRFQSDMRTYRTPKAPRNQATNPLGSYSRSFASFAGKSVFPLLFVVIRVHACLKHESQHLDSGGYLDVLVANVEIQSRFIWRRTWLSCFFARRTLVLFVAHMQRANDEKLSG